MKYEMIFGDEALFDGAGEFTGIDIVTRNVDDGLYRTSRLSDSTPSTLRKNPVVAMRSIIKEPKRWTWEDKRDGRLPEVGCDIQYIESQKRVSVIAINSNEIVLLAKSNGSKFFVLDPDSLLQYYNPIETPAEKSQRERDEWIDSAYNFSTKGTYPEIDFGYLYDALKSGELPMPNKE